MAKFRRIGVLTSGGDAPGMNPAVRAVTRAAIAAGTEVIAINRGYSGLIQDDLKLFRSTDVSNIISLGGTKLYSDRCLEFKTEEGMAKAIATCKENHIDGIVAIGGDGTFRGARDLTERGVPCIGITGTIDNDISSSDYTIGFDTALNTCVQMIDRLRDTCESHARCDVVEIMGNGCGDLAIYSGIAVGATQIITKEIPFDEDKMIAKMLKARAEGKRNFIVCASENMTGEFNEALAKRIQEKTGIETKFARLAHVQRGGSPTYRDRAMGTLMGYKAVELLLEGKSNLVVVLRNGKIDSMDISFALDLDKYYKGKMSAEEIAAIAPDDKKRMDEIVKEKRATIERAYMINDTVSI
ncbi:MAG: ATP-dependent 6-phosphofructokinase [Firmicutes bacterium]|nr:ATP-dependent 6-phosphofructokinase [Bacillota bacterium]